MGVAREGSGLIVATSIAAVEAVKDQLGVCRWNYVLRSMQQRAKSKVQSYCQSSGGSSSSASGGSSAAGMVGNKVVKDLEKLKRAEQSMNKVMDLSCWGPTTTRF